MQILKYKYSILITYTYMRICAMKATFIYYI